MFDLRIFIIIEEKNSAATLYVSRDKLKAAQHILLLLANLRGTKLS
jgi:hypothetical protein